MFKELPEMNPLRWLAVGAVVATGVIAIGYLAGEQKEVEKKSKPGLEGLESLMAGMSGSGGLGGLGGMGMGMGMGGLGGLGMNDDDSHEELNTFGAQIESESDSEDSSEDIDMSSIATKPSAKPSTKKIINPNTSNVSSALLGQLYFTFTKYVETKKYIEASVIGEKFLQALEKEYGKNHQQYCLLSIEVANVFKAVNRKDEAVELLKHAFSKLMPKTEGQLNVATPTAIIKHLISCCLTLTHLIPEPEGVEYTEKIYQLLEWWTNKEPNSEEALQLFHLWMSHIMHLFRKCGFWKKIEAIYLNYINTNQNKKTSEDGIDIQDMVENYVSALHQQGRTIEAIQIIEKFLKEMKDNKLESIDTIIEWGLNRMSKFYFYLDDFQNAQRNLLELRDYCTLHHSDKFGAPLYMPLSGFIELMTVNIELGNEEVFEQLEQTLKNLETDLGVTNYAYHSLTRSKYLITQEAVITNHYHLVFKVCIKRPKRPEGEYEKSEDNLERKLNKFFIEMFFDNPCKSEKPLFASQEVAHYDFVVDSPNFSVPAQPYNWYTTKMFIYADSTKQQLLGKHFQVVFLEPAALQRRRGGK
jgi:tetratricopeptide (TPR) repeat protein